MAFNAMLLLADTCLIYHWTCEIRIMSHNKRNSK